MDRGRIDEFLEAFTGFAAGATTIGLLAIADRSGLSQYLGDHGAGTPAQIASGAGLNERYVTEILAGLAAAGVVEYDPEQATFELPTEHALFLSSESSPYFMGGWLDMLPATFAQIDGISAATRNGGGVPFEQFGEDMLRGLDRGNGPSQRVLLTSKWLPAIPGLTDDLESGMRVADVGCGSGTAAILIALAYPRCEVFGYDVSARSIALAEERSAAISNVMFARSAIEEIPTDPPFGLITTFDVIHDLIDPLAGLRRIHDALAPDGTYLMMEPAASSNLQDNLHPRGALLYGISVLHCMTQSLAVGGEGVGAAWGRQMAEDYCKRAGFAGFEVLEDISNRFSDFYHVKP